MANPRQASVAFASRTQSIAARRTNKLLGFAYSNLLEHFLRTFNKAALIVSHDREFLKATCSHTLDLSRGKLTMYPGKIDAFLEYQEERREHDERVNATVQSKQKALQRFIEKTALGQVQQAKLDRKVVNSNDFRRSKSRRICLPQTSEPPL